LPELWVPFGGVETLVTIQAENLGTVVSPEPERVGVDMERSAQATKDAKAIFVCDAVPTTIEFLRELVASGAWGPDLKAFAPAPKRLEAGVPELKGRVATLPPPVAGETDSPSTASELTGEGAKVIIGTARPDPLFGIVDARVQACLNWVARSHTAAAQARRELEPTPFQKTDSFKVVEDLAGKITDSRYLTVVPRGGKVRSVLEDAPFDAVKNGFFEASVQQTKGLIVGSGGVGNDDTLSSALRGVWTALPAVRRSGTILLFAECPEGLGSPALEMLATGRISTDAGRRKEKYVEGLEEVFYLNKLKEEYDVLLLSGLPEVYAKSKIGLTTARGSGEAVGRLLNKVGRAAKVNVVTRAAECRIESA
jgi:hypothetical protein